MFQKVSSVNVFRRAHLAVVAALLVAVTAVATPLFEKPADAARAKAVKFLVCHRTNAIKNPYRLISVAWSSVSPNGNGHDNPVHDGPVFNVANPSGSHGSTPRDSGMDKRGSGGVDERGGGNDRWGDIFNAYKGPGNGNSNSNNWDAAGQAIFNGATFTLNGVTKPACRAMSAIDYIKAEREENPNKPMSDIMSELDDMGAAEDVALKKSLDPTTSSFSAWYGTCNQATTDCENTTVITTAVAAKSPSVTTEAPTNVSTGVSTNAESATLNGTVTPLGVSMVWYFEFDDDADFTPSGSDSTDVQEVPGTPGTTNSATPIPVTFNATGLNATKTYYYRTVGVATSGASDTLVETYLYGVTRQFTFGAPAAPTNVNITCGNTSLSVAFTAGSANGGTITNYQYSVDGGNTFTSLATPATTSPISITGLVNGTEYSVVIRAITASKTGADSATTSATPCGTPSSTTTAATNVQPTTATLNGHLTANGNPLASIAFTWGTSPTLASGNTITSANSTSLLGTANAYPVLANLTGLTGGTTYYFEVSGTYSNGSQTTSGGILSFTTPANVVPPTVTTDPATNITEQSATLNGTGTSNGASSTLTITWGTSPTLASGNTTVTPSQSPLSPSSSNAPISYNLTGLTGGTTYYFRVGLSNTNGSPSGVIRSFTTLVATTTTTAPTTTTIPSVVNTAGTFTGALRGIVWIDRNLNERKDSDEPGIPFTPMVATLTSSSVGGTAGRQLTFTTDAEGKYSVPSLEPGSWNVSATLLTDALARTFDSDSSVGGQSIRSASAGTAQSASVRATSIVDWTAKATVPINGQGIADFAGAGDSALKVSIEIPAACVKSTSVEIKWAGYDLKLGTSDDAVFTVPVSDREATIKRIPYGAYSITPICTSGVKLAAEQVVLEKKKTQEIVLVAGILPATGTSTVPGTLPWALAMIPAGAMLLLASRRRRTR